jgi:ABC-2 type transport system permease protein
MTSSRLAAIAYKEFFHIIHDSRSLIIIFLLPIIQLTMFGYAMNMEIQNVDLAVVDYDHSSESQQLVDTFQGSPFFTPFYYEGLPGSFESLFRERKARAILIIGTGFSRELNRTPSTDVQILIDGADPNAATLVQSYCNQVINEFNQRRGTALPMPFTIEPRVWYNPDLKSANFFVPGLIALILVMISALLTSIAVTREKETGTLEQILVSPVRPYEIILGKVLPYIVIALLDGLMILFLGIWLFGVPFTGSTLLLFGLTLIYVVTALSLGLLISTIVETQQVAMMIALMITLLPTVLLSGFIFPIKSMPQILQYVTYAVPAKYYLVIIRGIMLKGNTIGQLLMQLGFLSLMTLVFLLVALRKFRLNLEK